MNAGSRADHHAFCRDERWTVVRNARGGQVRHHLTFELVTPDGNILRTRVSRADTESYGPALWETILGDQLHVTEAEFWACVRDHVLPDRAGVTKPSAVALPAGLVYQLIHTAGILEHDVAAMTLNEATAAMSSYWSRPQ